jgi:hypothetical protein
MATIPLHCNICPKKPNFSDVSHLLTHIASKGHLSHYYKVKVRSGSDGAARELIETYDQWYAEWSVEDLMSERMNLKDKKRPRTRASGKSFTAPGLTVHGLNFTAADTYPTASNRASNVISSASNTTHARPTASRHNSQNSVARSSSAMIHPSPSMGHALDPRLVDPTVKDEPMPAALLLSADPSSMTPMQRHFALSRPPYPFLHSQGLASTPVPSYDNCDRRDSFLTGQGDAMSPQSYSYPEPPRQSRYASRASSSPTPSPSKTSSTPGPDVDEAPVCGETSNNKLKGVLWPGMNIFDSATPTARRRRNQKKDSSVVSQLRAASLVVEPTEYVWTTPDWQLKKEKLITGNVDSSSSPWKPSPIKRESYVDMSEIARKPYFGLGQLDRRNYNIHEDDLVEERLTIAAVATKRKRRIPVFKDDPDADYKDEEERATFSRPSRIVFLTQGIDKENEVRIRNATPNTLQEISTFKGMEDPFLPAVDQATDQQVYNLREVDTVTNFHRRQYAQHQNAHTLSTLANVAAAADSVTYHNSANDYTSLNDYGHNGYSGYSGGNIEYGPRVVSPYGLNSQGWQLQSQPYQYQNSVHTATHRASQNQSIPAPAGPTHTQNFSNELGYGMPHSTYTTDHGGHVHAFASTDMPSMFATNTLWNDYAPTNSGYEPEQDHVNGGLNAFGHNASAPMSTDYSGISHATVDVGALADATGLRNSFTIPSGGDDVPIESTEDIKVDEVESSHEQQELSIDENRTITAPPTPDY